MTVSELIEKLQALSPEERELQVHAGFDSDGWPKDVKLAVRERLGRTFLWLVD